MTGATVYHPSASIGNIVTTGTEGDWLYSEYGTILPYTDSGIPGMGKYGITGITFNAWISAGGPLAASSVQAVHIVRGIEVPLSYIRKP